MFSDVVGYTALMGRDENEALRALDAHRDLLRSLMPKFNGRMVGEIGDGTLTAFHSAIDAVNCAREVQANLQDKPELKVRIGIHLGDVVFSNNTVLGDGVNVASRIHALAPPGGICVSANVHDEIRNKPGTRFKDLGEQRFKNVSRPIRVYQVIADGSVAQPTRASGPRSPIALIAGASVVILTGLVIVLIRSRSPTPAVPPTPSAAKHTINSIAVLPLDNFSGDPAQDYFADGMTDELITDLAKISALRVISRSSVMQYKGAHRRPPPEIAKALNVDAVVEGSVMRVGDKVRITAQLIDAPADKHLWAESYERDSRDVLALQDELALAIANQINVELTPVERQRLTSAKAVNPEALDAVLKGNYYLGKVTREGFQKAQESYERAIKIDPNYAPGYAGLAAMYTFAADMTISNQEGMTKAREPLQEALRLDDSLAAAHSTLALVYWGYEYDWAAAERENRLAIALAPGDFFAHWSYGIMLLCQARFDEAEHEFKLGQLLNPLSPGGFASIGRVLICRGEYQEAIEQLRRALQIDPNDWFAHSELGWSYELMGDHAEALKEFQRGVALEPLPRSISMLGWEYARSGNREQAREVIERLNRLSTQLYVSPVFPALIYLALGDKKTALDLLEKGYEERTGFLCFLKVDPGWDSLHSEPRFIALMKKVGLDK